MLHEKLLIWELLERKTSIRTKCTHVIISLIVIERVDLGSANVGSRCECRIECVRGDADLECRLVGAG